MKKLIASYSDEKKVLFVYSALNQLAEMLDSPISEEYEIRQFDKDSSDAMIRSYQSGRFLYHSVDWFIVHLLSLLPSQSLLFQLKEKLQLNHFQLLHDVFRNALRNLACNHYYYSLSNIRFNNIQRYYVLADRYYTSEKPLSILNTAAVQFAFIFFPCEEIMSEIFSLYRKGVVLELDSKLENEAVGIDFMPSYFFHFLLNLLFSSTMIYSSYKVLLLFWFVLLCVGDGEDVNYHHRYASR